MISPATMKNTPISIFLLLCCISTCFSSPVSISDGVLTSEEASIGRNLPQTNKPCPVNFLFRNYTIITSRCKGPQYPPNLCCQAFQDFACPYAEDLNDLSNNCMSTMFSYINLYGQYPPGLFSSLCLDEKIGLICTALAPGEGRNSVGADSHSNLPPLLIARFLIFLSRWF